MELWRGRDARRRDGGVGGGGQVFDRLKAAVDVVEKKIEGGCARHAEFGVVTRSVCRYAAAIVIPAARAAALPPAS